MNKKQRQQEQILRHGFNLLRIFKVEFGPATLCKKLHRLEVRSHRIAEDYCNGLLETDEMDKKHEGVLRSLDKILNYKAQGVPCFFNQDPRGYALKIRDEYIREHNLDIYKDWGGYGIIAPEFDGN